MQVQIFLFLLDRIRHDRMRFHRTSRQDVFRPFANDSKWKTIEAFTCFYECNYGQSYKTAGQQIHLQSENKRTMSRYTAKQQDVNLLTRRKQSRKGIIIVVVRHYPKVRSHMREKPHPKDKWGRKERENKTRNHRPSPLSFTPPSHPPAPQTQPAPPSQRPQQLPARGTHARPLPQRNLRRPLGRFECEF